RPSLYTLSLHDALPISFELARLATPAPPRGARARRARAGDKDTLINQVIDVGASIISPVPTTPLTGAGAAADSGRSEWGLPTRKDRKSTRLNSSHVAIS